MALVLYSTFYEGIRHLKIELLYVLHVVVAIPNSNQQLSCICIDQGILSCITWNYNLWNVFFI